MFLALALLAWAQAIDINTADGLYNSGKLSEAAAQYRVLLKQMPGEPALLLRLAACEYSLGQYKNAEQSFRATLKVQPDLAPAMVGLGTALLTLGRAAEALPTLEKAVKLMPGDVQARRALGHAYVEQSEFIKGEDTLRQLVKEDPKDWESWYYLGVLLVDRNYSAPALEALEQSLKLYPDNPRALIYRAGALSQVGRLDEAESTFAKLSQNPKVNQTEEYHLGYAQLLFLRQKYDPALQEVETAIQQDPQSGKIRFWKARILLYQGREELAMKEAEKCVTLSPAMPGGRNLLLRIYRKLGKEKEAAEQAAWLRQHEDRVAMGRGR